MESTEVKNTSGIAPLGRAVLVRYYEPEAKTSSLIILPKEVKDREILIEQRAVVIEAGPLAWAHEPTPRAKPGDKVLIAKFSGHMLVGPADGNQYRIVNDQDIFAAITKE
jgi:co-chaperonin GroES (HSP10)